MVLDRLNVEGVAARFGNQAINHGDVCAELEQLDRQIRSDEPQATRHEDALVRVEAIHACFRGGVAEPEISRRRRILSLIQMAVSSVSVRATRPKLKNWL